MRKILILLAVSVCFALAVSAQEMPIVTVTGTAEVMVVPDEVIFSLDVVKTDMDMQAAKRQSDVTIAKVLELTRRFSIAPQNVKTDHITIDRMFEVIRSDKTRVVTTSDDDDDQMTGERIFKGYKISTSVVVKLTDISRFEEFFAESIKTGISEVDTVVFQTSRLRENKDKARDMAMKAAREKASAMAGSVGQGIGKAIKITEGSSGIRYANMNSNNNYTVDAGPSAASSVATFAPGSIKIDAEVTVSFLLN